LQRFYRYHELLHQKETNKRQLENSPRGKHKLAYWTVFKACFPQCFNTFLIFFVTLALFPSVQSDVQSSDKNFVIPSEYYSSVMCFLTFNITAMLGSLIASLVQWVGRFQFYILHILYCYIPYILYFIILLKNYRWLLFINFLSAEQKVFSDSSSSATCLHTVVLVLQLSAGWYGKSITGTY